MAIKQRTVLKRGRFVPRFPERCEPHTPQPDGYHEWYSWAEKMSETHDQRQCRGCGLWSIWVPKGER